MLKKEYLKKTPVCKVTFTFAGATDSKKASLVGDFNNWDPESHPMQRLKNGTYKIVVKLEPGREYLFRYLINGRDWHNDEQADRYSQNPFGSSDSVIVT